MKVQWKTIVFMEFHCCLLLWPYILNRQLHSPYNTSSALSYKAPWSAILYYITTTTTTTVYYCTVLYTIHGVYFTIVLYDTTIL